VPAELSVLDNCSMLNALLVELSLLWRGS